MPPNSAPLLFGDGRGGSTDVLRREIRNSLANPPSERDIPAWLRPPELRSERAKRYWNSAVLSRGLEWFKPADVIVLGLYCDAIEDIDLIRAAWRKAPYETKWVAAMGRAIA